MRTYSIVFSLLKIESSSSVTFNISPTRFINIVLAASTNSFASTTTCLVNAYLTASIQYGVMGEFITSVFPMFSYTVPPVGMLTFIIVDQYIACTLPLRYRCVMTLNKSSRIIICLWAVAGIFELPLFIAIGTSHAQVAIST